MPKHSTGRAPEWLTVRSTARLVAERKAGLFQTPVSTRDLRHTLGLGSAMVGTFQFKMWNPPSFQLGQYKLLWQGSHYKYSSSLSRGQVGWKNLGRNKYTKGNHLWVGTEIKIQLLGSITNSEAKIHLLKPKCTDLQMFRPKSKYWC